jgi:hypothetical protein
MYIDFILCSIVMLFWTRIAQYTISQLHNLIVGVTFNYWCTTVGIFYVSIPQRNLITRCRLPLIHRGSVCRNGRFDICCRHVHVDKIDRRNSFILVGIQIWLEVSQHRRVQVNFTERIAIKLVGSGFFAFCHSRACNIRLHIQH